MLIQTYQQKGLLVNHNVLEACTKAPLHAYRGELVLVEGEIGDAAGRRKPPEKLLRQAIALTGETHLHFIAGHITDLLDLTEFFAHYGADLTPDTQSLIFVVNIDGLLQVEHEGKTVNVAPLLEGMVWTELMELAALEKEELKGLSSADKVLLVSEQLTKNGPTQFTKITLADAPKHVNQKQRMVRGAI